MGARRAAGQGGSRGRRGWGTGVRRGAVGLAAAVLTVAGAACGSAGPATSAASSDPPTADAGPSEPVPSPSVAPSPAPSPSSAPPSDPATVPPTTPPEGEAPASEAPAGGATAPAPPVPVDPAGAGDADPAPGCDSVPLTWPDGTSTDVTIVAGAGAIGCEDARAVLAEYLELVSAGAAEGSGAYVDLRGGSCMSATVATQQDEGRLISCESPGWDTGGAADFTVYRAGSAPGPGIGSEGAVDFGADPVSAVLVLFGEGVEAPLCPAPDAEFCLEVLEETEDRAVITVIYGMEVGDVFLVERGPTGWYVTDQAVPMDGDYPDWVATALEGRSDER